VRHLAFPPVGASRPKRATATARLRRRWELPLCTGLLLIVVLGCSPPERAPEGLDDLLLFSFRHYSADDPNSAAALADALVGLDRWWTDNMDDPSESYSAELARLGDDELAVLDPPPSRAVGEETVGVLYARPTRCSLEDVDSIYLDNDQLTRFPDSYTAYQRREIVGSDCYATGACDEASWLVDIEKVEQVFLAQVTYQFTIASGSRRFRALPPDAGPGDDEVEGRLARAWLLDEAELEPQTIGRFLQNYQVEFLVPRDEGVLHFYALWTELQSAELDTEASIFLNSYIQGIEDYLEDVEEHCDS